MKEGKGKKKGRGKNKRKGWKEEKKVKNDVGLFLGEELNGL